MDWASIWTEIVGGLLIAGALAAWVPQSFWQSFFLVDHPLLSKIWGPIVGPLVGWLVSVINRYFRRYSRRIQDSMGDVTRVAKESFEAPRLIKVYNAEEHLGRQFDAEHRPIVIRHRGPIAVAEPGCCGGRSRRPSR